MSLSEGFGTLCEAFGKEKDLVESLRYNIFQAFVQLTAYINAINQLRLAYYSLFPYVLYLIHIYNFTNFMM